MLYNTEVFLLIDMQAIAPAIIMYLTVIVN